MSHDPFIDSLKRLAPEVPAETKSRLLYECGMAAAETRMQTRNKKHRTAAMLMLLMATGFGFFIGHKFPRSTQSTSASRTGQIADAMQSPLPRRSFVQPENSTTLAAAMPFDRVFELLDKSKSDAGSSSMELQIIATPLGTLSIPNEVK